MIKVVLATTIIMVLFFIVMYVRDKICKFASTTANITNPYIKQISQHRFGIYFLHTIGKFRVPIPVYYKQTLLSNGVDTYIRLVYESDDSAKKFIAGISKTKLSHLQKDL